MLKIIAITLVFLLVAFVWFSYHVSRPVVQGTRDGFEPVIADRADALTFARSADGLILVSRHERDAVIGVNLTVVFGAQATADLIEFEADFDEAGFAESAAVEERFALEQLVMPLEYTYPSVAAGTNFKEHAEEVYSDDPPFLFPKLAEPTNWNESVPFLPRLDYEAELCLFPLADIDNPDSLPGFGLLLCNDFTDRWTLIKELKLSQPLGLTGFVSGKGCDKCLPTGYLAVIPRSPDFYLTVNLSLYVNGVLRQQFSMKDVILPIEDIVSQAFATKDADFRKGKVSVPLLPHGNIPKGTPILTGTAAGVIFKPANIWNQGFYLKKGDVVRTEASYLGHLENTVIVE